MSARAANNRGVHAFTVTLKTAGTQWVRATDIVAPSITGAQIGIVVVKSGGKP